MNERPHNMREHDEDDSTGRQRDSPNATPSLLFVPQHSLKHTAKRSNTFGNDNHPSFIMASMLLLYYRHPWFPKGPDRKIGVESLDCPNFPTALKSSHNHTPVATPCTKSFLFRSLRSHHGPRSYFSLLMVVFSLIWSLALAQKPVEMVAWVGGSNVSGVTTGPSNSFPAARYVHSSFYDYSLKSFFVFGGKVSPSEGIELYVFASSVNHIAFSNEFWRFNVTSRKWTLLSQAAASSSGSYGTIGQESTTYLPSARCEQAGAYDPSTRCYYLFGGYGGT